jgi:hypothetical protein
VYRLEIEELTAQLRDNPQWEELRRVLRRRRVRPSDTLLAAFMEDEEGMEYGALVTGTGRVIDYQRRIGRPGRRPRMLVWRDRTDKPAVVQEYPPLSVALEMNRATH